LRTSWVDYCVFHNNGTNTSNVITGAHNSTSDPLLNDPANGDFTLQTGSPALATGLSAGTNIGVVGTYKQNIGVDQDDVTAGGGGSRACIIGG
jgi:hypothetical protein